MVDGVRADSDSRLGNLTNRVPAQQRLSGSRGRLGKPASPPAAVATDDEEGGRQTVVDQQRKGVIKEIRVAIVERESHRAGHSPDHLQRDGSKPAACNRFDLRAKYARIGREHQATRVQRMIHENRRSTLVAQRLTFQATCSKSLLHAQFAQAAEAAPAAELWLHSAPTTATKEETDKSQGIRV